MNRDFALSQGREEGFLWYFPAQRWGACSTKNCYSHQLDGMGLLKYLSKEGFGSEPPEFCHSQTLLFGMTMLAVGCAFLCEWREMKFLNCTSIKWGSSSTDSGLCVQRSANLFYKVTQTSVCWRLFICVWWWKVFSAFLLKGLMESCVTFLFHPVLDCLCAWEVQLRVAVEHFSIQQLETSALSG